MVAGSRSNLATQDICPVTGVDALVSYRRHKHRCQVCRAANAQYMRDKRAQDKAMAQADNVRPIKSAQGRVKTQPSRPVAASEPPTEPQPPEDLGPGPVELAIMASCETSPVAAERPELVAMALCLAKLMDNQQLQKDHTSASRQLSNLMAQLKPTAKSKMKARLVTVKKMTNRVPVGQVRNEGQENG